MTFELFRQLRRAKLDTLLLLISNAVRGMLARDEPVMNVPVVRFGGPLHQRGKVTVAAWNLSDLAYLAIRESSDFQTWKPSIHDLVGLCNYFWAWDEEHSRTQFDGLAMDDWELKFAVGFSQKQFWYQRLGRITEEFNRQVELLEVIPSEVGSSINLQRICEEVTGFDLHTFRTILLGLFSVACHGSDLTQLVFNGTASNVHPALTARNVHLIASFYAADYEEFRQSPLQENHFYLKPVVRTTSNRLLAVNTYMFAKKVADGPFWVIRDYYWNKGTQDFTIAFGEYFERYVMKLFQHCLSPDRFRKVPQPHSGKYADWFVFTTNYRLIVELKSSLAPLMTRRLYPDLDSIRRYLGNFQKGVLQLDSTEQAYPDSVRTTIKLLVHYETFYLSDGALRPAVVGSIHDNLNSTQLIYFCDIGEFEWLISLLGHSEPLAEDVLTAKIKMESNPGAGIELGQVIPRITDADNLYMKKTLNYWDTYIPGAPLK